MAGAAERSGLSSKARDNSFPARTRVVGAIDSAAEEQLVYLKSELTKHEAVKGEDANALFVTRGNTVSGSWSRVGEASFDLSIDDDGNLADSASGTVWNADLAHQNPCDRDFGSTGSRPLLRQNAESFLTCLLGDFLCLLCLLLFLSELRLVRGGGSLLTFTHGDPLSSGVDPIRRRPDSANDL